MQKPIVMDLFCGAGGMSEGILQAGFHIVYSSDISSDVQLTYMHRHEQLGLKQGENTYFERADIRNLKGRKILNRIKSLPIFKRKKVNEIDAIFGGPPCQGFSRAGKRDKNDPRNMLFKEYIRIVDEVEPRYVVMENVEGFLDTKLDGFIGHSRKKYNDNTFVADILKEEFKNINYNTIGPVLLDASDYGVPQKRKRVIFIAYRNDQVPPVFPEPTTPNQNEKVTVEEAISNLSAHIGQQELFESDYQVQSRNGRTLKIDGTPVSYDGTVYNHDFSRHTQEISERFSLYRDGENKRLLSERLLSEGIDLNQYPALRGLCILTIEQEPEMLLEKFRTGQISPEMMEVLLTRKNSRVRLNRNEPSPTMVTLPDDFINPFEDRILTVREMARLQSFDDSFEFKGKRTTGGPRRKVEVPQYTQVGNAVPPLLAKAIALEIKKAIDETNVIKRARTRKSKAYFKNSFTSIRKRKRKNEQTSLAPKETFTAMMEVAAHKEYE